MKFLKLWDLSGILKEQCPRGLLAKNEHFGANYLWDASRLYSENSIQTLLIFFFGRPKSNLKGCVWSLLSITGLRSQRQFAPKCSFLANRALGHCPFRIYTDKSHNFRNFIFMASHFSTLLHSDVSLYRIWGKQQVKWRTSTGSESFSLLRCLENTKFVFLNIFSIIETIWSKNWSKSRLKFAKRPLPVDVRRLKENVLA